MNRTVLLTGAPCGIPAGAVAVSVNITVFNITGAAGNGVFKVDTVSPPLSAWINYPPTEAQRGNAGVVALTVGGQIIVQVAQGAGQVDFVVDTNGYYGTSPANQQNFFAVNNNSPSPTILGSNSSTICVGPCGISGIVGSGNAVEGVSTTGGDGVYGQSSDASGAGVHGFLSSAVFSSKAVWGEHTSTTAAGIAVYGSHAGTGWGVEGQSFGTTGFGAKGVYGTASSNSDGTVGVEGDANASTGVVFGVLGVTSSSTNGGAGVRGVAYDGEAAGNNNQFPSGVVGTSAGNNGVLGTSFDAGYGVVGFSVDGSGTVQAGGYLGSSNTRGIFYFNGLGGTGTKSFIEPHPTDPSKLIEYVSIEGPEAGVYFRGRGRAHHGLATIDVPENFRMVAAEEGLSIQVTPIGETANVAVLQIDLDRIVVKATQDIEFFYTVNGVRKAYPNWNPIQENRKEFVPAGPNARLPVYLSANERQRLIDNGTYRADGTVNMETARRTGWDQLWQAKAEEAAQRREPPR